MSLTGALWGVLSYLRAQLFPSVRRTFIRMLIPFSRFSREYWVRPSPFSFRYYYWQLFSICRSSCWPCQDLLVVTWAKICQVMRVRILCSCCHATAIMLTFSYKVRLVPSCAWSMFSLHETRLDVLRIWLKWCTINSCGGLQTGIYDQSNLCFTIATPHELTTTLRMLSIGLMSRFFS